jgi:hypothetical protein
VITALTDASCGVTTTPALAAAWIARAAHDRGRDRIPCLEAAITVLSADTAEHAFFFRKFHWKLGKTAFCPSSLSL